MNPIAFFCSEYAIEDALPIFAGGLGILAGDLILEVGEQNLPFVALGLFYSHGFSTNAKNNLPLDPRQAGFEILKDDKNQPMRVQVELDNTAIIVGAWSKRYGPTQSAQLLLLDTNQPENSDNDRLISQNLYPGELQLKIKQQMILAVGGIKFLRALGITPSVYHLNEGHTAFVLLALALEYLHDHPDVTSLEAALEKIKPLAVATKHTILPGAGIYFQKEEVKKFFQQYLAHHHIEFDSFFNLGTDTLHPNFFSTTKFLMKFTVRSNGVSRTHCQFEKIAHSHSPLIPITNGVNVSRWKAQSWKGKQVEKISGAELWDIHCRERAELVKFVAAHTGVSLDPSILTLVWARRITSYKRPALLFYDLPRLVSLVSSKTKPVQFILSGQASSDDQEGQELIIQIGSYTKRPELSGKVVYLSRYDLSIASKLVKGADVWLNTPELGKEACGTSSMKAGLNGALQLSTHDGWIAEVNWEDRGWTLPEENAQEGLYWVLENQVIPSFYQRDDQGLPSDWITRMRSTMDLIEEKYTTKRMLADYLEKLYFPNNSPK